MTSKILVFLCFSVLYFLVACSSFSVAEKTQSPEIDIQEHADFQTSLVSPGEEPHPIRKRHGHPIILSWLHIQDKSLASDSDDYSILAYATLVPEDLYHALRSIDGGGKGAGFWRVLAFSVISICSGFSIMFAIKKLKPSTTTQPNELIPPKNNTLLSFWSGFLNNFPAIASLLLATLISLVIFLFLTPDVTVAGRMFFQALLGIVFVFKICAVMTRIIFSPEDSRYGFFSLSEVLVKPLSRSVYVSLSLLLSGIVVVNLFNELGAHYQTVTWLIILVGTLLVVVCGFLIIYLKKPIAQMLISDASTRENSRYHIQIAGYWDRFALLYLLLVWLIWVGQELSGTIERDGAFIATLFVVPVYFLLIYLGKILIGSVVESLALDKQYDDPLTEEKDVNENVGVIVEDQEVIVTKANFYFRLIVLISLITWILTIWGIHIPYASYALKAIFQSSIALILAFLCWKIASSFIENRIQAGSPVIEKMEEDDNEFGSSVPRGRAHTLLPILRKVIGSILVTMVLLMVVSSFGVNIGPLLAGAGVIGIAIGFGAQKLVSDILSGFFFLLDDAFRVGEYIQAGSMRGTVEAITLRNVMLRHHLGSLQVVPYSDLGAIVNYMRGGIVIKFPLEFPYDTDIDLVRKTIKRVGEAMIQDEELGDDFLQPVKSQGVYEIANSVMVIRVKFTAKPGKQFVIRREAYRRITEALNAKGIYYAHRKVIVDFPDEHKRKSLDEDTAKKVVEGAAAAVVAKEEQLQKRTEDW